MLHYQVLIEKLLQINQKIYGLKMNLRSQKHLIRVILLAKVILKKMVHKTIQYFNQFTDILKLLLVLVMVITVITGNLKDFSDERINCITASNYSVIPLLDYYGTKRRVEFSGSCLKQDKQEHQELATDCQTIEEQIK